MENMQVELNNFLRRESFCNMKIGDAFLDKISGEVNIKTGEESVMCWNATEGKWGIQTFTGTGEYPVIKVLYMFG